MAILESAEFWSSCAFLILCVVLYRPTQRYLKGWTKRQADKIRAAQQEADDVLEKAKKLHQSYGEAYQNRMAERHQMMVEADGEIEALDKETKREAEERMARRRKEVDFRLKTMTDQGHQNIKQQLVSDIMQKAQHQLEEERDLGGSDDPNALVQRACETLEKYAPVLGD